MEVDCYQLFFYVPESHLDQVKQAIFEAGAGTQGDYSNCCWQIKGMGQFLPSNQANPFLGKTGALCQEVEYKVEVLCLERDLNQVVSALKNAHPYEEPAYGLLPLIKSI